MKDRKNEKIIKSSNLYSNDINEKNLIKKIKNDNYGFLGYNSKTFLNRKLSINFNEKIILKEIILTDFVINEIIKLKIEFISLSKLIKFQIMPAKFDDFIISISKGCLPSFYQINKKDDLERMKNKIIQNDYENKFGSEIENENENENARTFSPLNNDRNKN